jgi:hypothetical protein
MKRATEKVAPAKQDEFTSEGVLPMWTASQVIRNRDNGMVLLVVHVYRSCTIVVNLNDNSPLIMPMVLLEREYHYWSRDTDIENTDPVNYEGDWYYHPVDMREHEKHTVNAG